jgi:Fe2+ transport system protein FeoA
MTHHHEEVTRLHNGQSARIVALRGGDRAVRKLAAMGINPGMIIRKKSQSPLNGPVIIEKDGMLFALSRSLAQRIIVETDSPLT